MANESTFLAAWRGRESGRVFGRWGRPASSQRVKEADHIRQAVESHEVSVLQRLEEFLRQYAFGTVALYHGKGR